MNIRDRGISKALMVICKELEQQMKAMEAIGITVNAFEEIQMRILNSILRMNGVKENDPDMDIAATHLFGYLAGELELNSCMNEFAKQLYKLRKEKRGEAFGQ